MKDSERCRADLIRLGELGRRSGERVERREQLSMETGLIRVEGSPEIKASKDYLIERMKEAGLKVRIDPVGNIFGRREGFKTSGGAVMAGSHLDSVLNGGMFDGALGVIATLEAARRMEDEGFQNDRPIEVAVFTGEEGSAFHMVLLGSSVLIGEATYEEGQETRNDEGVSLRETLQEQGHVGDFQLDLNDIEYFVELHVEQGPILHNEGIPLGVVENVTGLSWVKAIIQGEENHAGTTPMSMRIDPLVASADIIKFVNRRASEMAAESGTTVGTTGRLIVHPGLPNIIPGTVELGIDIRDTDDATKKALINEVISEIKSLEGRYGVKTETEVLFDHKPSALSGVVIDVIKRSAEEVGVRYHVMNSGAGHDAQNVAHRVKTGMIFVPSVGGVSHSPLEWTDWEDIERGVKVLTRTLKNLSAL